MTSAKNLVLAIVVQGSIHCPLQLMAQGTLSEVRVEATQEGASESSESQPLPEQVEAMEAEQDEIVEELQISAPMEVELQNGIDPIVEAVEEGFIIEASIEQVKAAVDAADATPGIEDDLEAFLLKRRGSYRFFCESVAEQQNVESNPDPNSQGSNETEEVVQPESE